MFRYTRLGVNLISLFITIVIFCAIKWAFLGSQYFLSKVLNSNEINQEKENLKEENHVKENVVEQNVIEKPKELSLKEQLQTYEWGIAIDKIDLIAPIKEGTSVEIMNQAVGHFTTTSLENGNVGLAAHNRGYPLNYFQNIKKLSIGDIILYKKEDKIRTYKVEIVTVIKDDDWTYLEKTNENRITLITCVENEPRYRRCIQAVEMEEEK